MNTLARAHDAVLARVEPTERILSPSLARPAASLLLLFTVLTGFAYPMLVTGLAQALFPHQANGSLIEAGGTITGSELNGQSFGAPEYFWSRPSATSPRPYNGGASAGSNYGPIHSALKDAVASRIAALRAVDPRNTASVPIDLVTASASGLDPHITPAAAYYQGARVARARSISEAEVRALIDAHVEPRVFGLLGEPRVNVLFLNRALDAAQ